MYSSFATCIRGDILGELAIAFNLQMDVINGATVMSGGRRAQDISQEIFRLDTAMVAFHLFEFVPLWQCNDSR